MTRRRKGWLTAVVLGALVFLFFAASLLAPHYVLERGEHVADAVVLTASAALVAFAGYRLRVLDRRILAAEQDFGAWLPAEPGATGTETRRLRGITRRAAALTLIWFALLAGGAGPARSRRPGGGSPT